jgi:hypothetical protein
VAGAVYAVYLRSARPERFARIGGQEAEANERADVAEVTATR